MPLNKIYLRLSHLLKKNNKKPLFCVSYLREGEAYLMVSIKNSCMDCQPRERLREIGAESLSTSELLAIMLRTGTKDKNVLTLATEILSSFSSLSEFKHATLEELMALEGIGPVKAIELHASLELGKRCYQTEPIKHGQILSSQDIGERLTEELKELSQEKFLVLCLNSKNEIIKKKVIFIGSLNRSLAHPREIFKVAVACSAASIIVAHNHPSGNPTPSKADHEITERFAECGDLMGIQLVDHIVVGSKGYVSFKEMGKL